MADMAPNWQRITAQLLPPVALGAVAFALALAITDPPGPGLDPDAMAYLGAAESLAMHGEFRAPTTTWASADSTEPLAHFPPGYPAVLAIPVSLGMQPAQAARLVQATAAFITVATLVVIVTAASSGITAVLVVIALLTMTAMHEVHASVLSEPVFLACLMLTLLGLVRWPERPLAAALPAAAGVITRYAGLSLVAAAALWALMQPGSWPARIRRAVVVVLPAMVLQGAWVLRTRLLNGPEDIRTFELYGNLRPMLAQGAGTLAAWLVPDAESSTMPMRDHGAIAIGAAVALVTLAMLGAAWISYDRESSNDVRARSRVAWRTMQAVALIVGCYAAVVGASRVLADPDIPLDERMLAPVLLLFTLTAGITFHAWWLHTRLVVARVAVAVALGGWWLLAAQAVRGEVHYALDWGSDFAGHEWRTSETLAWARTSGRGVPLWSNWPAAVYFYLHRPARELPRDADVAELAAFADTLRVRHGRILMFDARTDEFPSMEVLRRTPGLRVAAELPDGTVFEATAP